ncbi:MAG: transcriptional regulator [Bacteroidetes bacterium]|nr:transcriptional regulator [Bacteroidota bacterium]|tara:strand:- start:49 stop:582 length:534 start_codon:yes stop_codon:yes gene_type:complete
MLEALITSKTRIKLLLKFFLNSKSSAYLRNLESEFGDSTNAIRVELIRFEKAGLLKSWYKGNKKLFQANTEHPLYSSIHNLIIKHVGLDKVVETVIEELGDVKSVFVVGNFAKGIDNKIIDLIFVGEKIDRNYLSELIEKTEKLIDRKIRYLILSLEEFKAYQNDNKGIEPLLLWRE